jgi:hypothetical protein
MQIKVFETDAAGVVGLGAIEADRFERISSNIAELGLTGRVGLVDLLGPNFRMRTFNLVAGGEALIGCRVGKMGGARSGGGCEIEFERVEAARPA